MNTNILYKTFCAEENKINYELIKMMLPKLNYEHKIINDRLNIYSKDYIEGQIEKKHSPIIVIYDKSYLPDNHEYIIVKSTTIDFLVEKTKNLKAFI